MTNVYQVRLLGEIVHVELAPRFVICLQQLMPLWADILVTIRDKGVYRVLIEGDRPERSMEQVDAGAHGDFVRNLSGRGIRAAFCLYEYKPDSLTNHFIRVANSGSCKVKFFHDLDAAMRWLGA